MATPEHFHCYMSWK